jgi:hypothetical protein
MLGQEDRVVTTTCGNPQKYVYYPEFTGFGHQTHQKFFLGRQAPPKLMKPRKKSRFWPKNRIFGVKTTVFGEILEKTGNPTVPWGRSPGFLFLDKFWLNLVKFWLNLDKFLLNLDKF